MTSGAEGTGLSVVPAASPLRNNSWPLPGSDELQMSAGHTRTLPDQEKTCFV